MTSVRSSLQGDLQQYPIVAMTAAAYMNYLAKLSGRVRKSDSQAAIKVKKTYKTMSKVVADGKKILNCLQ